MTINLSDFNFSMVNNTEAERLFHEEGIKALNDAITSINGKINMFVWVSALCSLISFVLIFIAIKTDNVTLLYSAMGLNFISFLVLLTCMFVRF